MPGSIPFAINSSYLSLLLDNPCENPSLTFAANALTPVPSPSANLDALIADSTFFIAPMASAKFKAAFSVTAPNPPVRYAPKPNSVAELNTPEIPCLHQIGFENVPSGL